MTQEERAKHQAKMKAAKTADTAIKKATQKWAALNGIIFESSFYRKANVRLLTIGFA